MFVYVYVYVLDWLCGVRAHTQMHAMCASFGPCYVSRNGRRIHQPFRTRLDYHHTEAMQTANGKRAIWFGTSYTHRIVI